MLSDADQFRDELTGLSSRPLLREHAELAVTRAGRHDHGVVCLHAGLDDFHRVNEALGRSVGDEVLRLTARRLREALPDVHVIARSSGAQFCVLLTDVEDEPDRTAEVVAGQIRSVLSEPHEFGGRRFELSATIGGSIHPADAPDADALLEHAEAARAQAKATNPGGLVLYAGGTSEALERLLLTSRLRRALDEQEFALVFQPIVRVADGAVLALEALLRWHDPQRGLIPPLRFIGAAEETGLIEPIGDWVFAAACAQVHEWRAQGIDIPVTVNVSPRQFRDEGFARRLCECLADHDVPASSLIVEITESTAMREPRCVEPVLEHLRRVGVRIAIDDFGMGHSSLGRLRDLDVDILKLDGAFLPQTPGDENATRLLFAVLELLEALQVQPVVEGVETDEQRRLLDRCGSCLAQGFHFSRPLPAAELGDVLGGLEPGKSS